MVFKLVANSNPSRSTVSISVILVRFILFKKLCIKVVYIFIEKGKIKKTPMLAHQKLIYVFNFIPKMA